jgi:hypothetical protein
MLGTPRLLPFCCLALTGMHVANQLTKFVKKSTLIEFSRAVTAVIASALA